MILVYASRTSNVKEIVNKLNLSSDQVLDISSNPNIFIHQDFYLLTYTDLLGQIPSGVKDFLSKNCKYLKGVAGSGNRNFGENFCGAAKKISSIYDVPLLATFELSGDKESIDEFRNLIQSS